VSNNNSILTHVKAFGWSIFGLFFVFIVIIEMNKDSVLPKEQKHSTPISINVQKVLKPKAKPKPKPKPKKSKPKPHRSSPTPNLSSSLSGIDTGLDAFVNQDSSLDNSLLGANTDNVVMTEGSVDKAPSATQRSAIAYPKKAKKMGAKGYVILNLLIDKNGNVVKVKVLESEPQGVFDAAAIEGVKNWKFTPGEYKGKPVKVWAKQKIRFDFQ